MRKVMELEDAASTGGRRAWNGGQKELGGNSIQCNGEEQRFEEAEKVTLGFRGGITPYF